MTGRVQDKVAIVTGGGSGIGRAMATRLAEEGAHVVVVDVDGARAKAVSEQLGSTATAFTADISHPDQIDMMIEHAVQRHGRLDIMCNNAARSGGQRPLHETPLELFDDVVRVNLRGVFLVLQKSIQRMLIDGGGSIVNTASIAAVRATPGTTSYTSAKGGVVSLTRVAALEYAAHGIRVNALCPGAIMTEMVEKGTSAESKDALLSRIPMGRFGTPREMANVALFLASDEASFVTGTTFLADGGVDASA